MANRALAANEGVKIPGGDASRGTVFGHFRLTLVTGAVARNSIGIVLVGGMTIGTLFTLFVVPSLYVLSRRITRAA